MRTLAFLTVLTALYANSITANAKALDDGGTTAVPACEAGSVCARITVFDKDNNIVTGNSYFVKNKNVTYSPGIYGRVNLVNYKDNCIDFSFHIENYNDKINLCLDDNKSFSYDIKLDNFTVSVSALKG